MHPYSVYIYKRFSNQWWYIVHDLPARSAKDAIRKTKKKFFEENDISGLAKLMYYGKASYYACFCTDPLLDEPVISDSPTVDIPDVPVKSAEPDELDEWIKGLGD